MDKKNYVVHSRNLEYYIKKGLVLKKIHRVLELKQSQWLKKYIDFNSCYVGFCILELSKLHMQKFHYDKI